VLALDAHGGARLAGSAPLRLDSTKRGQKELDGDEDLELCRAAATTPMPPAPRIRSTLYFSANI
jgi:hypothetical protein